MDRSRDYVWFVKVALMSLAVALPVAGFNFIVDPLQLLGPARFYPARYSSDPRIENAGLVRSQDFDTVFIGTSLALHFRPSEIDKYLGGRSIKLATSGATSKEQLLMLTAALSRHPKRVIWQMDDWMFRDSNDVDSDIYINPDRYRRNAKGVAGYLFSFDTARESLWIVLRSRERFEPVANELVKSGYLKFDQGDPNELNTYAVGADTSVAYNSASARAAFARSLKFPGEVFGEFAYEPMVRNFERDAFDLIQKYPDVNFVVYFPPYSVLHYAAMREAAPDAYNMIYRFSAYTLNRLSQLANVTLFDFRDVTAITEDLSHYRDTVHADPSVDLKILSALASGDHIVTRSEPTASIDRLKRQVEAYRDLPNLD